MSYEDVQEIFTAARARLGKVMSRRDIDSFLKSTHPDLDGHSPARCIHCGRADDVNKLIDKLTR